MYVPIISYCQWYGQFTSFFFRTLQRFQSERRISINFFMAKTIMMCWNTRNIALWNPPIQFTQFQLFQKFLFICELLWASLLFESPVHFFLVVIYSFFEVAKQLFLFFKYLSNVWPTNTRAILEQEFVHEQYKAIKAMLAVILPRKVQIRVVFETLCYLRKLRHCSPHANMCAPTILAVEKVVFQECQSMCVSPKPAYCSQDLCLTDWIWCVGRCHSWYLEDGCSL